MFCKKECSDKGGMIPLLPEELQISMTRLSDIHYWNKNSDMAGVGRLEGGSC
jgi:hypothetical protein